MSNCFKMGPRWVELQPAADDVEHGLALPVQHGDVDLLDGIVFPASSGPCVGWPAGRSWYTGLCR